MVTQPIQLRAVCTANYDYHNADHDHDCDDGKDDSRDNSCNDDCEDDDSCDYDP